MEEINSGISSAAEAVQNQLLQTEAIQDRIENVQEAADKIDQNVNLTMSAVATGRDDVATLVAQADRSVLIREIQERALLWLPLRFQICLHKPKRQPKISLI